LFERGRDFRLDELGARSRFFDRQHRGGSRFRVAARHDAVEDMHVVHGLHQLARSNRPSDAPADHVEGFRHGWDFDAHVSGDVPVAIGRAADGPHAFVIKPDVPADVFVNALSQSLDLGAVERQSLLECDGVLERYRRLLSILDFRQLERARPAGPSEPTVH